MDSIGIEALAADWLARRDGAGWNERDEAEFQAWLAQSTAHVVAFLRLEAAWIQAKRLKALGTQMPSGQAPSPQEWQLAPFFAPREAEAVPALRPMRKSPSRALRSLRFRVLAAGVLLALAGACAWYAWWARPDYRTPVGGLAFVPMSDGSKVTLNTDSRISVTITETERRVELRQGEAFFEVAKDPRRPFIVTAGKRRVTAVGTAFSVRRDGDDVRVTITEGRVRLEHLEPVSGNAVDLDDGAATLAAGSVARATDAGVLVQHKPIPEIQNALSWRSGYLVFRDLALADAVAEFNRYNARRIVISDPSVAAIRVSGKFRATQFEAFVRLLEAGFPITAQSIDDEILLSSK